MVRFEYTEPKTLNEAISLLAQNGNKAKVLAGGTDLLVVLKHRTIRPQVVVNIKNIPELCGIKVGKDAVTIGALTTHREIELSPDIRKHLPMLADAVHTIGSVQIRNLGTVGGNICNASPAADSVPSLVALGTKVVIVGPSGERSMLLEEFMRGPGKTALAEGEILKGLEIPKMASRAAGAYMKHGIRKAMEIAIVGVASVVTLDGSDGVCKDARIVLGAVAPTAIRAKGAEAILKGQKLTDEVILQAAEKAMTECTPISDVRSSAWYRTEMVKVFTKRATKAALAALQG